MTRLELQRIAADRGRIHGAIEAGTGAGWELMASVRAAQSLAYCDNLAAAIVSADRVIALAHQLRAHLADAARLAAELN